MTTKRNTDVQHLFPTSSNIRSMKLKENGDLYVVFKSVPAGEMVYYVYKNVDFVSFMRVIKADSIGSAFHRHIKSAGFKFRKVSRYRDEKTGRFTRKPLA